MCGRFALFRWTPAFAATPGFPTDQLPHWSISPNSQVLLLRTMSRVTPVGARALGLTPPWLTDLTKTPAQARAETLAEQPMFREGVSSASWPVAGQWVLRVARGGAQAAVLAKW